MLGAATVMIIEPNEDIPCKGTMLAIIPSHQINRVVAITVVTIIVTMTVNAVITINAEMIIASNTPMVETMTIINVLSI